MSNTLLHRFPGLIISITTGLLFLSTGVQATDQLDDTGIQLDKAAYFSTVTGENIQLQPGNYELQPFSEGLQVAPRNGGAPIPLDATMVTHDLEISQPMAASVPGLPEGETSDRHVLALLLPGGISFEAEGTYSGIQKRALDPHTIITDPAKIYLEKAVHFVGPEETDVILKTGTYTVEAAGEMIRLTPDEKPDPILLKAHTESHEGTIDTPIALSLPGPAGEEADLHYVVLLLPNGNIQQALGTYSGIHSRKLFKNFGKTVKKAQGNLRRFKDNARRSFRRAGQSINKAKQDAARWAKKAALDAKKKAEWVARQAAKGALIAAKSACKAGLTASRIQAEIKGKILGPILSELGKAVKLEKVKKSMRKAVNNVKRKQAPAIQKAINAANILAKPKNSKSLKKLTDPKHMCENPAGTLQRTLKRMVGKPLRQALNASASANNSGIRTRGTWATASVGLAGDLAKVGGGDVGAIHAFDFTNKPHWYLNLAGQVVTNIGGGAGVEIGIWPKKNPDQLSGWFLAAAVTVPNPKFPEKGEITVDFFWAFPLQIGKDFINLKIGDGKKLIDFSKLRWNLTSAKFFADHFQGFTVTIGAGKSKFPVDIAVKAGVAIRLTKQ